MNLVVPDWSTIGELVRADLERGDTSSIIGAIRNSWSFTLSFVPVFTLEAQEGKLFGPLAFTKTYSMAAAGLSVTLIPVLMFYFIGVPADSSAG